MYLKRIFLRNFRSFIEAEGSFCPGLNLIQGDNAQGKTNLLEAIVFLSTGRSFRTSHLKELIHHESPSFYLEAEFIKDGTSQTIKASFDGHARKLQYNQTHYNSFNPLLGLFPTILYAPEDVSLVCGSPAERRRFLDLHLAQLDPLYVQHSGRYHQAMKQRNHLLKQRTEAGMASWENIMAESGAYIFEERQKAIHALNPYLLEATTELSQQKDLVEMQYEPTFLKDVPIAQQFQEFRQKEMLLGSTLIGPHRDDILFTLNQRPAKHFSSEGQKRCILAALRFAQWQRVRSTVSHTPLLSIDDFGAHLDAQRRFLLQKQLEGRGQVFLTSPSFEATGLSFSDNRLFTVASGKIT